jgi:hypothetical protein
MSPPTQALPSYAEGRILLAIQALKLGHIQSVRAAAKAYDIRHTKAAAKSKVICQNLTSRKFRFSMAEPLRCRT